jgi:PAS domain S-box-containing protein
MDSDPLTSLASPTGLSPSHPAHSGRPATPHIDALDAIDVVVFELARDASVEFIGNAWERLSGFTPEFIHGTDLLDYVHPGDHEKVTRGLEDSRLQPSCLIARWLTRDGDCLRLEMRVRMRLGTTGERAGFVGTLTDVTRQSQDADVRQASHRTVETLINNLPGMVYRCRNNRNWTMEYVSHGARELTGWQPEDFVNNTRVAFASLIVEEDRQRVWDQVQVCLRENRPFEHPLFDLLCGKDAVDELERGRTAGRKVGARTRPGELLEQRRAAESGGLHHRYHRR